MPAWAWVGAGSQRVGSAFVIRGLLVGPVDLAPSTWTHLLMAFSPKGVPGPLVAPVSSSHQHQRRTSGLCQETTIFPLLIEKDKLSLCDSSLRLNFWVSHRFQNAQQSPPMSGCTELVLGCGLSVPEQLYQLRGRARCQVARTPLPIPTQKKHLCWEGCLLTGRVGLMKLQASPLRQ